MSETETVLLCAWVDGVAITFECEEPVTFVLRFQDDGKELHVESCDHHLADMVRGVERNYGARPVVEEYP